MGRTRKILSVLLAAALSTVLAGPTLGPAFVDASSSPIFGESTPEHALDQSEYEAASLDDVAEAVHTYLRTSGIHGYSAIEIRAGAIVVQTSGQVPAEISADVASLAGAFPVRYERVEFTEAEYIAATDRLTARLGPDATQLKKVSMRGDQEIQIEILRSERTPEIERMAREELAGFPLRITLAPLHDPGPQFLAEH